MNRGAFDFVTKPIDFNDLQMTIEKGMKEIQTMLCSIEDRRSLLAVQRDLSAATRIQQSILPRTFPPFPHRTEFAIYAEMHPAKDIGGDFYDFFFIDETHLGFVIGDVSGKGIPAAIYMAVARTMIKGIASQVLDPGDCLAKVNAMLVPESDASMFVTVFYGVLETTTGIVRYSNGGHNAPYLISREAAVIQIESGSGILLGKFAPFDFDTREVRLAAGDRFLMYTDGVTEALNSSHEMYSDERLAHHLSSRRPDTVTSLVQGMVVDVLSFIGRADQSDDITVVSLEYNGVNGGK